MDDDCNVAVKREVSDGDYVDSAMRVEFVPILPAASGKWQWNLCTSSALINSYLFNLS